MTAPTDLQAVVLRRLCELTAVEQAPPSLSALRLDLGGVLPSEMWWALEGLADRGLVRRTPLDRCVAPFVPTADGWRAVGWEPPMYRRAG